MDKLRFPETPGYHATGRSAAFWTESYGGAAIQPLTTASGPFLREHGLLARRQALTPSMGPCPAICLSY